MSAAFGVMRPCSVPGPCRFCPCYGFSYSHPRQAGINCSAHKLNYRRPFRQHTPRDLDQHCRHCSPRAAISKSSEHAPDNGTEERKASNSEAGTSGSDKGSGQSPAKTPNKQVAVAFLACAKLKCDVMFCDYLSVFSLQLGPNSLLCCVNITSAFVCSAYVDFSENICFIESRDSVKVRPLLFFLVNR